jgi:hypothetical protein
MGQFERDCRATLDAYTFTHTFGIASEIPRQWGSYFLRDLVVTLSSKRSYPADRKYDHSIEAAIIDHYHLVASFQGRATENIWREFISVQASRI